MPTSFMQKALTYLGLRDIDEEDEYTDDYDEPLPPPAHLRQAEAPQPEARSATVRPLACDDDSPTGSRPAVVRPLVPQRHAKVHVVAPLRFADAEEVGDYVKANSPVIVNLQSSDRDLARRMIDFCSGVAYALGGSMEKVADQVFLLTPSNVEVSAEEKQRLSERGLYQS